MPLRSWHAIVVVPYLVAAVAAAAPADGAAQEPSEYVIQGTVVDADTDQPLEGVSVVIRGTSRGTLTGEDGRFALIAPIGAGTYTLEISLIGRATVTRPVELGAERTVVLDAIPLSARAIALDELVVTGSGVAAERRMVGSAVESVSGDEINEAPGAGAIDVALQGKVAGAVISQYSGQPGGGVSIRLRGTSSILGGAEPLYVIDGVVVDNSAGALVSLSANAGRGSAALSNRLSDLAPGDIERIEVLKGAAAAALYGSRANNGVVQIFTRRGGQGEPRIQYRAEYSVGEAPNRYELNMAPTAVLTDVLFGGADSIGAPVDRYDIQDRVWQTAHGTDQHLSISGGSDRTSYYVSGGYRDERGIVRTSSHEKANGRVKVTQQVGDMLEVTANANVIQTRNRFVPEGEQTQGVLTSVIFTPTSWDASYDESTGRYPNNPVLAAGNPLDVLENWEAPEEVLRMIGSAEAVLRPTPTLTLRYLFGVDDYRQDSRYFRPAGSISPGDPGTIQNPIRFSRQLTQTLTANHEADLTDDVRLLSSAGLQHSSDRANIVSASATELAPGQRLVGGGSQSASQSVAEIRQTGVFLQERLGLADRLFVTGTGNLEASSAFGADVRWQFFPQLSASYLLHEEPAWRRGGLSDLISTVRLRGAFGETGGQPPGAYLRFDNYVGLTYAGRAGYVASTTLGNPELRPERQREYEAGIELGLFDDRASLELNVFDRETRDLVLDVPIPPSRGAQQQFQNVGRISNRGLEATLNSINVQRAGFTWTSTLQFERTRNRVEELVTDADTLVRGYLNAVIEGEPVGVFVGGYYARTADGEIAYDEDGLPLRALDDEGDPARKVLGDPNPDFSGSLLNALEMGPDLRLEVLLDGRFGNDVADFSRRILELFGVAKVVEREATGDTVPGTYTLNPNGRSLIYEEYVEDGSFVKLRELSLRYRLRPEWVRWLGARNASVRLAGRNLYTWTRYGGLDPEINMFAANTVARGVDFANTPLPRQFIVGLTLGF
ncbi:MAG: SusC/RagA family TonB-linked outer membrane protein [Gemmatimonadota bacterium]